VRAAKAAQAALWAELLKARRSRLPGVTVLAFTVAGLFGGLVMFILRDPGRARSLGLLGTKAELAGGAADWPAYLRLLAQIVAVGGVGVFGLVVVWLFGREFSQNTVKDLLALPVGRTTIVGAKFAVAALWCLALSLYLSVLGLPVGAAIGLPGWSPAVAVAGLAEILTTAAMTVLLVAPFALAASAGRGYLAGVAAMITAVFLAQVVAFLGYGGYFPWSVPALSTGLAGPDRDPPGVAGYVLVAMTGAAGVAGTAAWWRGADQDR
jgi:ABC-2 type transport system permease protein